MSLYSLFTIGCLVTLTSCVSIRRDIYFKDSQTDQKKTFTAYQPGRSFVYRPIGVNDDFPRQLWISVNNSATGAYAEGILIPFIPTFFFPGTRFSLDEKEPLKIQCGVTFDQTDPRYVDTIPGRFGPTTKPYSAEAQAIINKYAQLGKYFCSELFITLPNGDVLKPISSSIDQKTKDLIFSFNVAAASLKEFSVQVTKIQSESGAQQKVDIRYHATFEDWTRFFYLEKL